MTTALPLFEPTTAQPLNPAFDSELLSAIEDASLNASAPPEQIWLDGWLVRTCPAKAKRARSINAVAAGRRSVRDKLAEAADLYRQAGLPCYFRVTPFSQPADLDAQLATAGWVAEDDTRVMLKPLMPLMPPMPLIGPTDPANDRRWPPGTELKRMTPEDYAQAVGALRGSPASERDAHARRLTASPVPYRAWALVNTADGSMLAGGQSAQQGDKVGLYDVFTASSHRGLGLAGLLCEHLLSHAARQAAHWAYLQVEAHNHPARAVYRRLGFVDGYGYRYRRLPEA
ncbi:MAG: GNAT family N-acetyltransferase [Rubrivivax sp.]